MKKLLFILLILVLLIIGFLIYKQSNKVKVDKSTFNSTVVTNEESKDINKKLLNFIYPGDIVNNGYETDAELLKIDENGNWIDPKSDYKHMKYTCGLNTESTELGPLFLVASYKIDVNKETGEQEYTGTTFDVWKDDNGGGQMFDKSVLNNPFEESIDGQLLDSIASNDFMDQNEYNSGVHYISYDSWINCTKQWQLPDQFKINYPS
ncbi:MAG: hypothetical protein ACK5HS_03340 [Mycoplasmatales bacterium]